MAVVEYVDAEGHKRFADENSKAYESHLKGLKGKGNGPSGGDAQKPDQSKPTPKVDAKPDVKS